MKLPRRMVILALLLAGLVAACGASTEDEAVHVLTAKGTVGPIMARYLDRGIDRAESNQAKLVVIQIDTPGGLDSSMREIVQRIERSSVPVAVYVSPAGGRAASAGTFITMAGHFAVMAPNTSIGAASAVNADGSDIEGTLGKKVENDAVAFIRGIAELRGRNAAWAEEAVREAVAASASRAVELDVVDFVAVDLDELLSRVDGQDIELRPGTRIEIRGLAEAPIVRTDMTGWERFLDFLANPTLASLLITLGFMGLIFELANPGMIFPGVAGVIAMVLGFIGFGVMPVDTAGLVLIALALILFALELFVPSGGILGAGGVVALILGGIIAFRDTPSEFQPSRLLLGVLAFFIVGMFVSLAVGVARVRKMAGEVGTAALVGEVAIARTPLSPDGFVFVQGERWQASLEDGVAQPGERLRIVGAEGLRLRVQKERTQ
ncbi:MAG: nodulation protein NfeD [Thermoflexaceae bacterium]|nr:nodulation protein NfeD [Thermoflexaceae bacterium]